MAIISLETAQKHLDEWLEADTTVSTGQSYQIGTRRLTRADAAEIRQHIDYWSGKVAQAKVEASAKGRSRVYQAVPRDL